MNQPCPGIVAGLCVCISETVLLNLTYYSNTYTLMRCPDKLQCKRYRSDKCHNKICVCKYKYVFQRIIYLFVLVLSTFLWQVETIRACLWVECYAKTTMYLHIKSFKIKVVWLRNDFLENLFLNPSRTCILSFKYRDNDSFVRQLLLISVIA